MARSWRPSCEDEEEEEEDRTPIFSMSKSSVDVLMAAGPVHARGPAWPRRDLPRSSSTDTHVEKNALTLQQRHAQLQLRGNARSTQQPLRSTQPPQPRRSPPLTGRWLASVGRWSGSAQIVASTSETVVNRGGTIRPWSLAQEALYGSSPDGLMSKLASPPPTPSPVISPVQTPLLSPAEPRLLSPAALPPCTHQQEDTTIPSPRQVHTTSPLPPPHLTSGSPEIQALSIENDCFHQDLSPSSSQCPSISSLSSSLEQRGVIERVSSAPNCFVDGSLERVPGLTFNPGSIHSLVGNVRRPFQMSTWSSSNPSIEVREARGGNSLCNLELPGHTYTCQGLRLPLMCSLSDSHLGDRNSRHNYDTSATEVVTLMASRHTSAMATQEAATASKARLVDAAVQTASSPGSWWSIRTNMSCMSPSMGSHSFLGSPPGSRLNLRSSLGSNSNLVSPSSSMFQIESVGEDGGQDEDDREWEVTSPTLIHRERRRSCLKAQREERCQSIEGGDMWRRGSMKQVQWDEDGAAWDVHGVLLDPAELSIAMQKHVELQGGRARKSPQPSRKKTEKKSAVPASSPVMVGTAIPTVEIHRARMETEGKKEGGCTGRISRNTGRNSQIDRTVRVKEDSEGEDDEVYGEEGGVRRTSSTRMSDRRLKKSVMRSLTPGWCGSSSKVNN